MHDLMTLKQFCERHKFISLSALRSRLFKNEELRKAVIVKLGKRSYIKEGEFFKYLEKHLVM